MLTAVHEMKEDNSCSFFTLDFISLFGVKRQTFDLCRSAYAIFFTLYVPFNYQ